MVEVVSTHVGRSTGLFETATWVSVLGYVQCDFGLAPRYSTTGNGSTKNNGQHDAAHNGKQPVHISFLSAPRHHLEH